MKAFLLGGGKGQCLGHFLTKGHNAHHCKLEERRFILTSEFYVFHSTFSRLWGKKGWKKGVGRGELLTQRSSRRDKGGGRGRNTGSFQLHHSGQLGSGPTPIAQSAAALIHGWKHLHNHSASLHVRIWGTFRFELQHPVPGHWEAHVLWFMQNTFSNPKNY